METTNDLNRVPVAGAVPSRTERRGPGPAWPVWRTVARASASPSQRSCHGPCPSAATRPSSRASACCSGQLLVAGDLALQRGRRSLAFRPVADRLAVLRPAVPAEPAVVAAVAAGNTSATGAAYSAPGTDAGPYSTRTSPAHPGSSPFCGTIPGRARTCYAPRCQPFTPSCARGREGTGCETATDRFGPLLRRLRLVAGLSQEELAERSGRSARGISALETGYRAMPAETVRLLADALALDAARAELVAAARPELADPAERDRALRRSGAVHRWRCPRCRCRRPGWWGGTKRWPRSAPACAGKRCSC